MKSFVLSTLLVSVASASPANLQQLVKASLTHQVDDNAAAQGVYNCPNKCQNLLGFLSYMNAQEQQANGGNNEYRGCVLGCDRCGLQRDNQEAKDVCFDYCKNYKYTEGDATSPSPIKKGIIEPDKACIIGCVINLCQGLCTGNAQWADAGSNPGCQIMTGYGVQTYSEGNNFDQCCSNLQNVCTYQGPKKMSNPNYKAVVNQAHTNCNGKDGITATTSVNGMCDIYDEKIVKGEC